MYEVAVSCCRGIISENSEMQYLERDRIDILTCLSALATGPKIRHDTTLKLHNNDTTILLS
jgi:hypothetical protein